MFGFVRPNGLAAGTGLPWHLRCLRQRGAFHRWATPVPPPGASPGSGWFLRATSNEKGALTRSGSTDTYKAVPRPELRAAINDAMQAKYTWGDTIIEYLVGGRDDAIPLALIPAD